MNLKVLLRILLTSAVTFGAAACGIQPMSELSSESAGDQKNVSVLAFALACSPINPGSTIRSARVLFDGVGAELRLDANGSERLHSFASSQLIGVTGSSLDVSWPIDQVSFKASLEYGRVFKGELMQGYEVVALNCYKIVTAERDSDEFSLACIPISSDQARVEGLDLSVHDVVLTWEDRGLEMIVNPTSQSLIYDFERSEGVEVSERLISAFWNLEQASFRALSIDGIQFDAQLTFEGQSSIPLRCWKL